MNARVIPIDLRLQEAWDDYCECRDAAMESGDIRDGKRAGEAWRRWLELFLPTAPLEAQIIPFKKGPEQ
jgi:hypothetical protein